MEKLPSIRIFLLRGLAREIRHWGLFPIKLEEADSRVKVYPVEIPGTGELRREHSPMKIGGYVDKIRNNFLQHRITGDFHVIAGLSFGGMIAAHWADRYQNDFQAAILINSSGAQSPLNERLTPGGAFDLVKSRFIKDLQKREQIIASRICNLADCKEIGKWWAEISRTAPFSSANGLRQLICAMRFRMPERLDLPTLLINSTQDRLVSSSCSETLRTVLQKPLITHPNGGHDLPTDDPDWCVSTIVGWLKSITPHSPDAFFL